MLRPLIIDDAARAKAARIASYAMDHPYRKGDPVIVVQCTKPVIAAISANQD